MVWKSRGASTSGSIITLWFQKILLISRVISAGAILVLENLIITSSNNAHDHEPREVLVSEDMVQFSNIYAILQPYLLGFILLCIFVILEIVLLYAGKRVYKSKEIILYIAVQP